MEKQKAIERLNAIDKETKELRKIIENADRPKNVMERVKTFDDACAVLGIHFTSSQNDTVDEIAYKKLKIICKALNEGWTPNWSNSNETKYFPWFEMKNKPGSSFGFSYYANWNDGSAGPSRLAYKTKELALYAATQFELEYYNYLILQ